MIFSKIFKRFFFILSFILNYSYVKSQGTLDSEINDFMQSYKKLYNELEIKLNCKNFKTFSKKNIWMKFKAPKVGKSDELCCSADVDLFIDKDEIAQLKQKSIFLQSELTKRVGFKESCHLNWLTAKIDILSNSIDDLLFCKKDKSCDSIQLDKHISKCRISLDDIKHYIDEENKNSKIQTCLQTNLAKPVKYYKKDEKNKTYKLASKFSEDFLNRLQFLLEFIHNNMTKIELAKVKELSKELNSELSFMWTVSIMNPQSIKNDNNESAGSICHTIDLSAEFAVLNAKAKEISNCMNVQKCMKMHLARINSDLLNIKEKLATNYSENPQFVRCFESL